MQPASARYVVDDQGEQTAVIIDIDEYRTLLAELRQYEEEEDRWLSGLAAEARAEGGEGRPAEEVFAEIERERGWHIPS